MLYLFVALFALNLYEPMLLNPFSSTLLLLQMYVARDRAISTMVPVDSLSRLSSVYFELYLESGTLRKTDKRWAPLVTVLHPVSFVGAFASAGIFVLVVAYANMNYIAQRATSTGHSQALIWFLEFMQSVFPLIAVVVDLLLARAHLKTLHRLISYEDQWLLTPLSWCKVLWYSLSTPLVLALLNFIPPKTYAITKVSSS